MKAAAKWRARGALALALCPLAAVAGSHVVPYGKDTFVTTTSSMNAGKAVRAAALDATQHCEKLGKKMQPDNQQATPEGSRTTVTLIFRCYDENDPRYREPVMRQAPDTVIEDQRH